MPDLVDSAQTDQDVQETWVEIREISARLSHHARNQEWKAVGELHAQRDGLIRSFFAKPVAASEANEVRQGILAVLESDNEVVATMRQERSNTAEQMKRLQSGREASKAYIGIGSGV